VSASDLVHVHASRASARVAATHAVHVHAGQLPSVTTERGQPRPTPATTRGGDQLQAYTVEQVAEMLHIGRDKIYYLLRTGQLRSIKIGKLRRITDKHLAEFVASLEARS
jgi:excisionase family DNA binding protein